MIFYDRNQAIKACEEEPSLIFNLIKDGYYEIVEELLIKNKVNINTCDSIGNNVMMKLLKYRQYDLVSRLMLKRDWDINHQNDDGNTFAHLLVNDNSIHSLKLLINLTKKKDYIPNIRNNKNETVFDRSIKNNSMATLKILEDKRFDNIDVISFKKLLNTYINNTYYGKYSKLTNLEIIVDCMEKKELLPSMRRIIEMLKENMDMIKNAIMKNNGKVLSNIINSTLIEATL